MAKKVQEKRTMRINKMDGSHIDLVITRAASVDTKQSIINLDKLPDGTWRLIWDKNLMNEFTEFKNMEMIRESNEVENNSVDIRSLLPEAR